MHRVLWRLIDLVLIMIEHSSLLELRRQRRKEQFHVCLILFRFSFKVTEALVNFLTLLET